MLEEAVKRAEATEDLLQAFEGLLDSISIILSDGIE